MWTRKTANDSLKRGMLCAYDLTDLQRELPGFVTPKVREQAFNNEVKLRFSQIKGTIENPRNLLGDYSVIGEILESLDTVYNTANENKITIKVDVKDNLENLLLVSSGNFLAQRQLYQGLYSSLLLNGQLDLQRRLLFNLQESSSNYVKTKLKKAKQLAKDSKREIRVEINYIPKLLKTLEQLKYAQSFYPENWGDVEKRIDQIKDLAYKRGVLFLRESVKDYPHPQNNRKYMHIMRKAISNEKSLDFQ